MRSADPRARTAIALGATLAALAAGGCGRQAARRPVEAGPATSSTAATSASRAPVDARASGDADAAKTEAAGTGAAVAEQAAAAADAAIAAKAEAERQLEAALLVDEFLGTATPPLLGIGAGGGGGGGASANAAGNGPNFPVPQQPPPPRPQPPNPYGGVYNSLPGTDTTTGNGVTGSPTNGTGPLGMQTPTLATSPVPVNTRGEFVVPFATATVSKPFESDPAQGGMLLSGAFTGPSGKRWNVPGFWDGTQWKIRFAPDAAGQWSYDLAAQTSAGQDRVTGTFTAAASASPPFLTIERHQLRGSDGSWFRGRGYNAGYQGAETIPFQQLLDNSANIVSFWMQTPLFAASVGGLPPLEDGGIGTYDQSTAAKLDQVVADAEAAGMRLLPSIWPHDLLRDDSHWGPPHWQENPYHTITDPVGFFTLTDSAGKDSPQWHAQKNLYRYILARWGTSPAIIGWVAVVEIEGTTAGEQKTLPMPDAVNAWALAMRDAFAGVDPRRVDGGAYPLTISYSSITTGGDVYDPGLDLLGYDSYEGASSDEAVAGWIGYIEQKFAAHGALGIITEFGADIAPGTTPAQPTQPRHLHNGSWAAIGGGATIAPVLWTDNSHFQLPDDAMQAEWKRLAAFDAELAQDGFDGADLQPTAATDASGAAMALASDGDRGCAWILGAQPGAPATATTPAIPGPPRPLTTADAVTFPAMHAGTYDVTWFDAAARAPAADVPQQIVLSADGALAVPVPTGLAGKPDAAVIVVRQGAPSGTG